VPLGQRGRDRLTNLQGMLDMAHPGQSVTTPITVSPSCSGTRVAVARRRRTAPARVVKWTSTDSASPRDRTSRTTSWPIDVVALQVSDDPGEQRAVVIGVEVEQRWR
jgi:hypothetical protein